MSKKVAVIIKDKERQRGGLAKLDRCISEEDAL